MHTQTTPPHLHAHMRTHTDNTFTHIQTYKYAHTHTRHSHRHAHAYTPYIYTLMHTYTRTHSPYTPHTLLHRHHTHAHHTDTCTHTCTHEHTHSSTLFFSVPFLSIRACSSLPSCLSWGLRWSPAPLWLATLLHFCIYACQKLGKGDSLQIWGHHHPAQACCLSLMTVSSWLCLPSQS